MKFFDRFQRMTRAAKPDKYYGDGGTIHRTTHIDIEVDPDGYVVGVWYRCRQLPFRATIVSRERAAEMRCAFARKTADGVFMPTSTHTYITGLIIGDEIDA
jgi:hypothetical protein